MLKTILSNQYCFLLECFSILYHYPKSVYYYITINTIRGTKQMFKSSTPLRMKTNFSQYSQLSVCTGKFNEV